MQLWRRGLDPPIRLLARPPPAIRAPSIHWAPSAQLALRAAWRSYQAASKPVSRRCSKIRLKTGPFAMEQKLWKEPKMVKFRSAEGHNITSSAEYAMKFAMRR